MPVSRFKCLLSATLAVTLAPGCGEKQTTAAPDQIADTVYTGGRIYTANDNRDFAEAFAVKGDEIIFAGSKAGAAAFIGETTKKVDLEGRLVLPGIHDVHIHPVMSMDVDTCTIDKRAMTLAELVGFVSGCIARTTPRRATGSAYSSFGNLNAATSLDAQYPTIRAALDAAAAGKPGGDGRHGRASCRHPLAAGDGERATPRAKPSALAPKRLQRNSPISPSMSASTTRASRTAS
ncbi:MAG: hypothetical protein R3C40_11300 [Parvularculaceae bacterium]